MRTKQLLAGLSLLSSAACGTVFACVARGARVRVPGGARPIEALVVGDQLLCVDPLTGEQVSAKIFAIRTATRECVRLVAGSAELILTADHPVYCPSDRRWAPAGDWALGKRTQLLQFTDEGLRRTPVTEVFTFAGLHEVFDLSVEHPLHNFVANGVLVHNKAPVCTVDGRRAGGGSECMCGAAVAGVIVCESPTAGHCECPGSPAADAGALDAGSPDGGP